LEKTVRNDVGKLVISKKAGCAEVVQVKGRKLGRHKRAQRQAITGQVQRMVAML